MTEANPLASEQITQDVYPASQEEAQRADGWRFHYGSRCPADCDEVYYRRRGWPMEALGPTTPHLIRWTDTGDSSDILAWHPVFSGFQRRHRIAALSASPAPSGQGVSGVVAKLTSASDVKAAVRAWLDADDATYWGTFETALDAAINETPERALIVAMLRADAATMRANADAYSEEAPTDARALHEVAATLGFKAAQIERGDHLDATPKAQDREAATFQAIHEAMMDERDGKPCGCIIERGCEAAGYHDPESAADSFKADAVKRVLALSAPAPSCAPAEVDAATAVIRAHAARLGVKAITITADTAALSPQGLDAKEGVTLYREVDALGGTGEGDWHAGYTEALTEVLNILTKRGFTEAADAKDGGQRVAFYWKDGSDIREGESLSDRDRRIYEQGRRDERVGEPEAFQ